MMSVAVRLIARMSNFQLTAEVCRMAIEKGEEVPSDLVFPMVGAWPVEFPIPEGYVECAVLPAVDPKLPEGFWTKLDHQIHDRVIAQMQRAEEELRVRMQGPAREIPVTMLNRKYGRSPMEAQRQMMTLKAIYSDISAAERNAFLKWALDHEYESLAKSLAQRRKEEDPEPQEDLGHHINCALRRSEHSACSCYQLYAADARDDEPEYDDLNHHIDCPSRVERGVACLCDELYERDHEEMEAADRATREEVESSSRGPGARCPICFCNDKLEDAIIQCQHPIKVETDSTLVPGT